MTIDNMELTDVVNVPAILAATNRSASYFFHNTNSCISMRPVLTHVIGCFYERDVTGVVFLDDLLLMMMMLG